MASTLDLTASLHERLRSVARRIRRLRLLRGVSFLLLSLAVAGGLALLADYALELPAAVRGILLAGWIGLGILTALFGIILPQRRRIDPAALAAVIEEKYPELGERLTSSVELASSADGYHGSPALIAMLMQETEVRTRPLDFLGSVSPSRPLRIAAFAAVALLLGVLPGFVWPSQYGELAGRFLSPWSVRYAVEASSGDGIVKRGTDFVARAKLVPGQDTDSLPDQCIIVLTDLETGSVRRLPMLAAGPREFSRTIEAVGNSFRYHVEAGAASSAVHQVTSVIPVELAARSPEIVPIPPAYAEKAEYRAETTHGLFGFSALEHSTIRFRFAFNRPAERATLFIGTPASGNNSEKVEAPEVAVALPLTADRLGASFDRPLHQEFTWRLSLEAEHGITTDHNSRKISVIQDTPPVIEFPGKEELQAATPTDRVPVRFEATDDIAVMKAAIEYRINEGPIAADPVTLRGAGKTSASADTTLILAGKGLVPDSTVLYRIRVEDDREVPELNLGPQVSYYPPDRWLAVHIVSGKKSLREQEIVAQRDEITRRLEKIKSDLGVEKRQTYQVQQETRKDPDLSAEHAQRIENIRNDHRTASKALLDVVDDAFNSPGLEPLGLKARELVDREMRQAESNLDSAPRAQTPQRRFEDLGKAEKDIAEAIRKIEEMQKQNEQLARQRLDQLKLEQLADRQKDLARKADELVRKDPVRDPDAAKERDQLKRDQDQVARDLRKLAEESEALKESLEAARAAEALALAERASELAQAQRDLAKASETTEAESRQARFADLARRQQELAGRAADLARRTEPQTRAAGVAPLKPEEAARAAEALKRGDPVEALQLQNQAALDLDRLAADLDRADKSNDDPREAARQLARLEEQLRDAIRAEANRKDAAEPLADRLKPLEREQQAVAEMARELSVPARDPQADNARRLAAQKAEESARALRDQNIPEAARKAEEAQQALQQLANRLPDLTARRREALAEINQLRRTREEVNRQVDRALEEAAKAPQSEPAREQLARELGEAARKQAELNERLDRVDPAALDERKERTENAAAKALLDLKDGNKEAMKDSQEAAKRELDRLAEALSGKQPADDQARDLARKPEAQQRPEGLPDRQQVEQARGLAREQRDLQRELRQMNSEPQQAGQPQPDNPLGELARRQQDLARQAGELAREVGKDQGQKSPQSEQARQAAEESARAAQQAQSGSPQQAEEPARKATEALRELARQMAEPPQRGETDPKVPSLMQQARELARRQEELNRQMAQQADNHDAQKTQQTAQQESLQQQTKQLKQALDCLCQNPGGSPKGQQAAQQAAQSAQQAQQQMQQAQQSGQQGQQSRQQSQQQQAARALDRAAQQARQASGKPEMAQAEPSPEAQAGEAMQQARDQIDQAKQELGQGRPQSARDAMQQAAQSLQQAAQSMQQATAQEQRQPGRPDQPLVSGPRGAPGGGLPDLSMYGIDPKQVEGKSWGELDGNLRTRVIQAVRSEYGEDYARRIKLYFEEIADSRRK